MGLIRSIAEFLLGPSVRTNLPPPVQLAIEKQQQENEKLVSWILLSTVLLIGILYFFAPKPIPLDPRVSLVFFTIGIYLIFASIRLIASYFYSLPPWFLILSAIIDVVLLMGLIWSLHIVYHQPAAFYLKAPALIFIFILLSLRTLRFEVMYVLIVGFTAVAGWLMLLFYAIETSPASFVSKNYVDYMTAHHIYIFAEITKVLVIVFVTLILALGVIRNKRILIRAIAATQSTRELSKFFEPQIASTIIQAKQNLIPGYGEHREITVLHCDIRDFTRLTTLLPATEVIKLLIEYQSMIATIISTHNGNIDKFLGDGILASFNAITPNPAHASSAIRTALEIIKMNEIWNKQRRKAGLKSLRLAVTLSAGNATVGVVGNLSHLEYTIIGPPVNLAAKLDKLCKILQCKILTTDATYTLAVAQGLPPLKGIKKYKNYHVEGILRPLTLLVLKK